ncbi:MAG: hypothetical protein ACJ8EL_20355 [Rhizomicrobium sp.]
MSPFPAIAYNRTLSAMRLTVRVMRAKGLNETDKGLGQSIAPPYRPDLIVQTLRLKRTRLDGSERRKGVCVCD